MDRRRGRRWIGAAAVIGMCLGGVAAAGDGRAVTKGPLDHAVVHVESISRHTPVRIRELSVEHAYMGKTKHRDVSEQVAKKAPRLLAAHLLEVLHRDGFTDVATVTGDEPLPEGAMLLEGEFTVFDPGSQAARIMWGFGSGKSRVCLSGTVRDRSGSILATFEDCRKGMGWGKSSGELEKEVRALGEDIAAFFDAWASGRLAR